RTGAYALRRLGAERALHRFLSGPDRSVQGTAVMDFRDRHIVVTGGTGALGSAVVGALLGRGASCHVPYIVAAEAQHFPHRGHERVRLVALGSLADEAAVTALYSGVSPLWASIHIA